MNSALPRRTVGSRTSAECESQAVIHAVILFSLLLGCGAFDPKGVQAQPIQPSDIQASLAPVSSDSGLSSEGFSSPAFPFNRESSVEPVADRWFSPVISPSWCWVFRPQGFLYRTYWASSAEPRMSTQLWGDSTDNVNLDSQIAGRLGIVRFGLPDAEEGFQLDLLAGAKLRQDLDHEIDMVGTDYRFDLPLTYRQGTQAWKFGFYHVSSHTGDEFLLNHPGFPRLNYYRDALYFGYSFSATPELRLYAELDYAFFRDYADPWHIQFGFDYGPVEPTGARGAPFLAMNVHLREELNFGGNIQVQGGWAWNGEGLGAGTLRTGPFFYSGGSPQFSFYQQNEQQFGWGLWYDF